MNQCAYHASLYATRARALKRGVRHPGAGRKALAIEAATVAKQCPSCLAA